jgi:hypothetical protein
MEREQGVPVPAADVGGWGDSTSLAGTKESDAYRKAEAWGKALTYPASWAV